MRISRQRKRTRGFHHVEGGEGWGGGGEGARMKTAISMGGVRTSSRKEGRRGVGGEGVQRCFPANYGDDCNHVMMVNNSLHVYDYTW